MGPRVDFTGTQCCVPEAWTPAAGTIGGCKACDGLFWTGTYCLVRGPAQCVPGTSGGCKGPAVSFTGTKCCVPPDMTCVAGTIDGCKGPRKTWTGSMCCTEGMNNQCFASASSDCSGPGAI